MSRDRSHRASRTHGRAPYDAAAELGDDDPADAAGDITQQFWGSTRGWVPRRPADASAPDADTTGGLRALRSNLAGLRSRQAMSPPPSTPRTRQHGLHPDDFVEFDDFDRYEPQQDFDELDEFDDVVDVPLTPSRQVAPLAERLGVGAVDPLLLRLGVLVLIGMLLAPLALALRSGGDSGALETQEFVANGFVPESATAVSSAAPSSSTAATAAPQIVQADPTATAPAPSPSSVEAAAPDAQPATAQPAPQPQAQSVESQTVESQPAPETTLPASEPAAVAVEAERVVPACPQRYEANPGDSWYRIAEAAGVSPGDLLRENGAALDTVILPGDSICLPAGAKVPAPPAPPTTAAPATTAPAAPPSTSTPPASTVPMSQSEVEQLIRDVWPDDLEERALEIAWRESKYRPNAYNGWCCYGLFQIHWGAHQSWLDDLGIHTIDDLRDARKNTEAAYAIYQRAGGWGPWGG